MDFGAGRGRIYKQLKSDSEFINNINYCALEPEEKYHSELQKLDVTNIYTKHTKLPEDKFDFVLLCNVLHEVHLGIWKETLNAIIKSLKSDGYLIIIEPKVLNKGEKIDEIGYLLLGLEELKQLFNLNSLPIDIKITGKEDINIMCAVIEKTKLCTISDYYIKNALKALENRTFQEIEEIKKQNYDAEKRYAIGRKTAFLAQQHINAKIAQNHIR